MMSGLKVLVVEASIAGPAKAYWLAKASAKVTVIKRFPNMRIGGQAIDIRTAGVLIICKMAGIETAVRAKSAEEEGMSLMREDGRPYMEFSKRRAIPNNKHSSPGTKFYEGT